MYRIAMVCSGNICRSPMAEAVLRRKLADAGLTDVEVDSFGTGAWHEGQDADPRALAVLRRHGYPLEHTARMIAAEDVAARDLVVGMTRTHVRHVQALDPDADVRLLSSFAADWADPGVEVPDPYYDGDDGFEHVLRLVESGADGIVAVLHRGAGQ